MMRDPLLFLLSQMTFHMHLFLKGRKILLVVKILGSRSELYIHWWRIFYLGFNVYIEELSSARIIILKKIVTIIAINPKMSLVFNQIISKQFLYSSSLNVSKALELFHFSRQTDEITIYNLPGFQRNFIYNNTIQLFSK